MTSDSVLVGAGTSGLIQLICSVLDGEKLTVAVPTFTEYEDLGESYGWSVQRVNRLDPGGTRSSIGELLPDGTDLYFLCNPNNPTGRALTSKDVLKLANQCEHCGARLVVDEAYLPLTRKPSSFSVIEAVPRVRSLIVLRSFSKTYGMAGVRIGYLVANPAVVQKLRNAQNPWPVGTIAFEAASRALEANRFVERSRQFLHRQRTKVSRKLRQLRNLDFIEPSTNFFLCRSGLETIVQRLRDQSLYVRSARTFTGLEPGWFRFSLQTRRLNTTLTNTLREFHAPK